MRRPSRTSLLAIISSVLLLGACASTPSTAPGTVIRTLHDTAATEKGFSNILVIGVAGSFESRAQFERELVDTITDEQLLATAWYAVIGRRPQLTRTSLNVAIRSRVFDAVLITRLKGQDQPDTAPGRPTGSGFDLFGYDYPELNFTTEVPLANTVTFITEFYSTAEQRKIWSIESLSFDQKTVSALVSDQVLTITNQLREDDLIP